MVEAALALMASESARFGCIDLAMSLFQVGLEIVDARVGFFAPITKA